MTLWTWTALDDLDDPRLAVFRALKKQNVNRDGRRFVVEGWKLVERLARSAHRLETVLVVEDQVELARRLPVEELTIFTLSRERLRDLVGFNFHQGVLGCGIRADAPTLNQLLAASQRVTARSGRSVVLVCPALFNPENLGALIRLGDVMGAVGLVVGPGCPDPLSRRVTRVSMGASLAFPVVEASNVAAALDYLAGLGDHLLAAAVCEPAGPSALKPGATVVPFDRITWPDRVALLLGSEAHGLEPCWVQRADQLTTIVMRPGADSLNLAVATGILLYHLTRPN
ncbi:tRNA/rRNA methyltransferase (SpoU) [Isosphaera pallida ATCC 43644]|uniref:tRNA/rRNA methyltransferase (SpoU) n=1 Tax=Isosphaera pallida (strain ATCC 43644 / DSM 9630 / IS1B) TaxID=575540 RepID=E8QXD9_ISOPI|nr:RNA methyltransferase [Isosphaera pallida]ADV61980.1 tRNA/rRNA methyltransferase (SpoU) [Isosphaera pallida ATCC 43644]